MSATHHLGGQFHEMSRGEFEALPGTLFHGHPTGNFNADTSRQGFHVGTHLAAEEAVVSRAGTSGSLATYAGGVRGGPTYPAIKNEVKTDGWTHIKRPTAHPEHIRGGRVASPMVNSPGYMGSYGKGDYGDMLNSGDAMANGRVAAIKTRGETMRQGIYYKNASEDAGSVSAVLPNRDSFKTHEDYLVEARAAGKHIPGRALEGYSQIPGQQRIF
jgi:hypothetical protein